MKMIKKQKEALLVAAVLCTIMGNAFALPTGGVVTSGNVTNVADPSKVMTAGAHSIIDWKTFDIAKNEKVTFDTKSFMVLNNVNGGQESKILGMLVDQGKGRLLLVNPSGIVLGKDAVINANNITLSTLRISNDQFQKLISGETATFINDGSSKGVSIEKNAKITLKEALSLYGGKITIADGVEIVSKDYGSTSVDILAAKEVSTSTGGGLMTQYSLNDGLGVTIGNASIGTESSPIAHLDIRGVDVNLNGVQAVSDNKTNDSKSFTMLSGYNINVENSSFKNSNGEMFIVAPESWTTNKDVSFFELGANLDNNINIDNTNLITAKNDMTILGGNVNITKSNIDSGNNLIVGAVKNYGNEEGVRSATTYDTSTVTIDEPTTVRAKGSSIVYGAILNVNPNKFKHTIPSDSPLIEILDRNDLTVDEIIDLVQKHNPDISTDEIRSAFNSVHNIQKPVINNYPLIYSNNNDSIYIRPNDNSPSGNFERKDTSFDEEWVLIENGIVPKGYEGESMVVMDPNNPENSKLYIRRDPRYEAKITFETKDYSDKIPKNEKTITLLDGKNYGSEKINGNMHIKNLKTDVITKDKNIKVTFDLYNGESTSGVVEVYDADGNKIKTEWIDPFKRHAESVKETFKAFAKIGTDELSASKTSIEITVPAGGYFRITNNEKNSPSLKLHNAVNQAISDSTFCMELIGMMAGKGNDTVKQDVKDALSDAVTDAILKKMKDLPEKVAEDAMENTLKTVLDDFIKMDSATDPFYKGIEDSLKKNLSAKGIAETVVYTSIDAVSGFTKPVQDALFTMNKAFNKLESGWSKQRTANSKSTNFIIAY